MCLQNAAAAKSLQSCLTLCDPRDGSPPGSPVHGILQARTLEWVAIAFSNAGKWKVKVKSLSRVRLLATPWTAAHQALSSMGFSRREYWSGLPLPSLLPSVKWWGAAVHHRELRSVLCDDPEGWDGEVRRRSKRVGIYVWYMYDLLHCTAETNPTL